MTATDHQHNKPDISLDPEREIFFISDVHAGSNDPEEEARKNPLLINFLDYVEGLAPKASLYIVGDLFDYWFEYRHAIPSRYQQILGKLASLVNRGVEVRYVTGNHDYWMHRYFPEEMGIPIFHGGHRVRIGASTLYVHHGDGILNEDLGYKVLKWLLQNKWVVAAYRLIHPDLGIPIARWASARSRNHSRRTPEQARIDDQKYIAQAKELFSKGFDIVIMGHTHRPVTFSDGNSQYINLGDWIQHFTFARYDVKGLKLLQWQADGRITAFVESGSARGSAKLEITETLSEDDR